MRFVRRLGLGIGAHESLYTERFSAENGRVTRFESFAAERDLNTVKWCVHLVSHRYCTPLNDASARQAHRRTWCGCANELCRNTHATPKTSFGQ